MHRQAADSPILDLAHALGDPELGFEDFEDLVRKAAARDGRVVVSPRVDAHAMARAPVLVWRNATRVRLIHAFRGAHDAPGDMLVPGEPLICDGIELPLKHRRRRMDLEARGVIKGAQAIYLGPGRTPGFARLYLIGAEEPELSVASIIQIEAPGQEEPNIVSAAGMGAVFLHGAAVTIHKAQGSQWPEVQVFAPDLWAAAQSGRQEAGLALWKRLAYVAVTRAEERLVWVTRYALGRPTEPLGTADLVRTAPRWRSSGAGGGAARGRRRSAAAELEGGGGEPAGGERERDREQAVEQAARCARGCRASARCRSSRRGSAWRRC